MAAVRPSAPPISVSQARAASTERNAPITRRRTRSMVPEAEPAMT